jgi:hypothetical protein
MGWLGGNVCLNPIGADDLTFCSAILRHLRLKRIRQSIALPSLSTELVRTGQVRELRVQSQIGNGIEFNLMASRRRTQLARMSKTIMDPC